MLTRSAARQIREHDDIFDSTGLGPQQSESELQIDNQSRSNPQTETEPEQVECSKSKPPKHNPAPIKAHLPQYVQLISAKPPEDEIKCQHQRDMCSIMNCSTGQTESMDAETFNQLPAVPRESSTVNTLHEATHRLAIKIDPSMILTDQKERYQKPKCGERINPNQDCSHFTNKVKKILKDTVAADNTLSSIVTKFTQDDSIVEDYKHTLTIVTSHIPKVDVTSSSMQQQDNLREIKADVQMHEQQREILRKQINAANDNKTTTTRSKTKDENLQQRKSMRAKCDEELYEIRERITTMELNNYELVHQYNPESSKEESPEMQNYIELKKQENKLKTNLQTLDQSILDHSAATQEDQISTSRLLEQYKQHTEQLHTATARLRNLNEQNRLEAERFQEQVNVKTRQLLTAAHALKSINAIITKIIEELMPEEMYKRLPYEIKQELGIQQLLYIETMYNQSDQQNMFAMYEIIAKTMKQKHDHATETISQYIQNRCETLHRATNRLRPDFRPRVTLHDVLTTLAPKTSLRYQLKLEEIDKELGKEKGALWIHSAEAQQELNKILTTLDNLYRGSSTGTSTHTPRDKARVAKTDTSKNDDDASKTSQSSNTSSGNDISLVVCGAGIHNQCTRQHCKINHSKQAMKKLPCRFLFGKQKQCNYGDKCLFSHEQSALDKFKKEHSEIYTKVFQSEQIRITRVSQTNNDSHCYRIKEENYVNVNQNPIYIDSGATTHVISSNTPMPNEKKIPCRNITGLANVKVQSTTKCDVGAAKDALKVTSDKIPENLLSVSKLIADTNSGICMLPNGKVMQKIDPQEINTNNNWVQIGEKNQEGLYETVPNNIHIPYNTQDPEMELRALSVKDRVLAKPSNPAQLWHQRHAHKGISGMKEILRLNPDTAEFNESDLKALEEHWKTEPCSCQTARPVQRPYNKFKTDGTGGYRQKASQEGAHYISVDTFGPMPNKYKTYDEKVYFTTFVDEFTGMMWTYLMKSRAEYAKVLRTFLKDFKNDPATIAHKRRIVELFSDGATEMVQSKEIDELLTKECISVRSTCPGNSSTNGRAESAMWQIQRVAAKYLTHAAFPVTMWGDAVLCATYALNRTPRKCSSDGNLKTPLLVWYKESDPSKVDLTLYTFGARTTITISAQERKTKMHSGTVQARFIGQQQGKYKFWIISTGEIAWRRSFRIDECMEKLTPLAFLLEKQNQYQVGKETPTVNIHDSQENFEISELFEERIQNTGVCDLHTPTSEEQFQEPITDAGVYESTTDSEDDDDQLQSDIEIEENEMSENDENEEMSIPPTAEGIVPTYTAPRGRPPKGKKFCVYRNEYVSPEELLESEEQAYEWFNQQGDKIYTTKESEGPENPEDAESVQKYLQQLEADPSRKVQLDYEALNIKLDNNGMIEMKAQQELASKGVPASKVEVTTDPSKIDTIKDPLHRAAAQEAIITELHNIVVKNNCFVAAKKPINVKLLDAKMFLKNKKNADGSYERCRGRLVVKGFQQIPGLHFDHTNLSTSQAGLHIRLLVISTATYFGLNLMQLDICSAYLGRPLDRVIYLKPPKGILINPQYDSLILSRAVYGAKQSGRLFEEHITKVLMMFGLKQSPDEECLFVMRKNGHIMILAVFVDDIMIAVSSMELYEELVTFLNDHVESGATGEATLFVGMEIQTVDVGSEVGPARFCKMEEYTKQILELAGMNDCNPRKTPFSGIQLSKELKAKNDNEREFMKNMNALTILCSMGYLSNNIRIDIAHIIRKIMRYSNDLGPKMWDAMKACLRYLKGTQGHGIMYYPKGHKNIRYPNDVVTVETDSDFAGDLDEARSTLGKIVYVYGQPIYFESVLQKSKICQNTAHAEMCAINHGAKDVEYFVSLARFVTPGECEPDPNLALPVTVYNDNQAAVILANSDRTRDWRNKRNRYYDIRLSNVRVMVREGIIQVKHIPSADNGADCLTKELGRQMFVSWTDRLMSDGTIK